MNIIKNIKVNLPAKISLIIEFTYIYKEEYGLNTINKDYSIAQNVNKSNKSHIL